MDEGYTEDVTEVSRAEDVRAQGKESENLVESCNVLAPQERIIPRERDLRRSSVQQFVDILGGKDASCSENVVEIPENPCTSNLAAGDGRVQELTLGNYSTNHTVNEGELMDTSLLDEWQHRNQIGLGSEAETTHKHPTHKEKCQKSLFWKDSRLAYALAGQGYSHNASPSSGQSTYDESDAVLQHALTTGAMRMKVISKSSEFPEYFVKNTLKGRGMLCRGPSSVGEFKSQNMVQTVSAPVAASSPPVKIGEKSVAASSPPVKIGEKSVLPSECDNVAAASSKNLNVGMNLRELMRSRQLNKVDSMYIFKHALDLVYSLHLDGMVLMDLRPSCFRLLPSKTIEYFGRVCAQKEMPRCVMHKDAQKSLTLKRPLEQRMSPHSNLGSKRKKFNINANFSKLKSQFQRGHGSRLVINKVDANVAGSADSKTSTGLHIPPLAQQHAFSEDEQQEDKGYISPEDLSGRVCTSSSNIYSLGVLFFELLSSFDSVEMQATAMSDLRHRILSPNFLSETPKEAGFCLWLLHPEPSSRPTSREILQSEVMSEIQAFCGDEKSSSIQEDEVESELLLHFLLSVKEQKQKHAATLVEHLGCIESDIKELEKRHPLKNTMMGSCTGEEVKYAKQRDFLFHGNELSNPVSNGGDARFLKNAAQLESAYFSARSQIRCPADDSGDHVDRDILTFRENWHSDQNDEQEQKPLDDRVAFFDGLCKYARYNKLNVRGTIRNRDITNSTNVVCSLSFDRDEEYFAAAGVSKKIKIFDFQSLYDNSVDIHYPVVEMTNKSKLSCVCWNSYIRNYLTSTDYDGIVKLWDASTGQEFSQHTEHEKRAWSVDFSTLDPVKLASGSDDCTIKLWSINERKCLDTIRNIANVCCVQFSPYSSHLLAFGSADYKIYCYDLRNANAPWCVLAGHEKAVSYVKFVDSGTLASASTDNTLKLWDLSRTSSVGLSNNACSLTLGGHKNEKNFVGLSVSEGYITCGSETNEVYTYYKSLPMPITSHKFGSIDPISGKETDSCNGQFVSSVCWKGKSKTVVAANSSGCIKVLEMCDGT